MSDIEKPLKSLGEKLFAAMTGVAGEAVAWSELSTKEQAQADQMGLAFAASLSHDETARAVIAALEARATKAESERDRLREALEPFAKAADDLDETDKDTWVLCTALNLTVGDIRRAALALSTTLDETHPKGGLCDNCSNHAMDLEPVEGEGLLCGYCRRGMASQGCGTGHSADAGSPTQELQRLRDLINSPEVDDFMRGVPLEATHQVERWGANHDAGKAPLDWFWLIGYLAQKAATSAMAGDVYKAKHHTISTAAALANWHRALSGGDTAMRPGIDPVALGLDPIAPSRDEPTAEATAALAIRNAAIEAIALLDVAIAGTVFTKPQNGRVIVNVAKAQKVLDALRTAIQATPVGAERACAANTPTQSPYPAPPLAGGDQRRIEDAPYSAGCKHPPAHCADPVCRERNFCLDGGEAVHAPTPMGDA